MARTAQDVLEFDKLRELLRLRTTCVLGKKAIDALEPGTDRPLLETAFAQIREAREWLRIGNELGFGGLADPQQWLDHIEGPGVVLEAAQLLDAASLLETAGWLRQQFREEAVKFPLLAARAASLADFRDALAAIRRCVLPNKEISDDASPALRRIRATIAQTRDAIQRASWHERHGADGLSRAIRDRRDKQPACAACGRRSRRDFANPARIDGALAGAARAADRRRRNNC